MYARLDFQPFYEPAFLAQTTVGLMVYLLYLIGKSIIQPSLQESPEQAWLWLINSSIRLSDITDISGDEFTSSLKCVSQRLDIERFREFHC